VVAAQGNQLVRGREADEPVDHAGGVGPPIDVIAKGNDQVVSGRRDGKQERVERASAAVDVSDGEDAGVVAVDAGMVPVNDELRYAAAALLGTCLTEASTPVGLKETNPAVAPRGSSREGGRSRAPSGPECGLMGPPQTVSRRPLN
jgi:hypothetical protein